MMWSLEPADELEASPARRGSVAKLTTASSSFANLLSVFVGASSPEPRPRRSFDAGGVGLGIVAAMSRACLQTAAEPIAIGAAARRRAREEDELSESYTCVITHMAGGGSVRKRVYFGFGDGWLVEADEAPATGAADFLSRCYLCDKRLDGLDIYMYSWERKPFAAPSADATRSYWTTVQRTVDLKRSGPGTTLCHHALPRWPSHQASQRPNRSFS
ncbi:hypothetical protein ACP70R_029706 [Stipagrostis hirtigluma subsp. patula]